MFDDNGDPEDPPDDSWGDVIEDFAELRREFGGAAAENRAKQAEAPEPTGEYEDLIDPPTHGFDPNVHLLIPNFAGDEKKNVARRPDGPPPLASASMAVTEAGSDRSVDRLRPDTEYEVECTVRNLGGNPAAATTFGLFVDHRRPTATVDTASDGLVELLGRPLRITGFTTLGPGSGLYALGYNPPSPLQDPTTYTPDPGDVLFRSAPNQFTDGSIGGVVREDRTFDFKESPDSVDRLTFRSDFLTDLNPGDFRLRLYENDVVDASPPYFDVPDQLSIDPSATYLRTAPDDDAADAKAIDLSQYGVSGGDTVKLTRVGEYNKQGSGGQGMIGVFSETDELRSADRLNRVPGAVDAGDGVGTLPTFTTDEETDITEDFRIAFANGFNPSVAVEVPQDAEYLFVSPYDNFFQDNADPDDDYALRITTRQRLRDALSATITALENQGTLLTDVKGRFPEPPTNNVKGSLDLASDVNASKQVDPPGSQVLPKTIEIPPTGQTTVTTRFRTPNTQQYALSAFHARVHSLSVPDAPADWDALDHTTSRFVGRTEVPWAR